MQKRFEMRRDAQIPVKVFSPYWYSPITLFSDDLSPRGLYVQCEELLVLDTPIICSFSLSRGYYLSGRVSRVNQLRRRTDMGRAGFGVEFTQMRPLTRISLRADLRGLPPPVPKRRRDGIWLSHIGKFIPFDV